MMDSMNESWNAESISTEQAGIYNLFLREYFLHAARQTQIDALAVISRESDQTGTSPAAG